MIDVLESIQQKLHEFRRVKVQHVRRQGNKSAHALAQHAKGIHGFVTWLEESPQIIESLVLQDAMYSKKKKKTKGHVAVKEKIPL